jgi:hypothetical protein
MTETPAESAQENQPEEEKLRDSEIAIIDALKMIVEIMVAKGIVPAEGFRRLLLRTFAIAKPPAEDESLRRAMDEPPQGSA